MMRGCLAIGASIATIVVAGCKTDATSAAARRQTAADSAEQVMYNARMQLAANGVRRGEVSGASVLTLDAASRFDFRPLQAQFTTALGRPLASLSAPGGEYSVPRAVLETRGAVVITSDTAGRRIEARAVRYDPNRNQLSSDSAFTATSGARTLKGVGFNTDPGLFSIKCLQRCTGSLGP